MTEYVIRFLAGGLLVSLFAIIGDIVRPKSFAGLFGAAPSVALATLGIAWFQHGGTYAGMQANAMILGGIALACYSVIVCQMLMRLRTSALTATLVALPAWFVVAFGLYGATGG
ncbi:MAG: DUF3147 family protein [Rhizobiales bacterium]|nr:DUF3147 family protein [Hyphomicrobiales bacterium]MBN8983098.1 DUF3147 family protein [Hyphomicrobiales bacterium]